MSKFIQWAKANDLDSEECAREILQAVIALAVVDIEADSGGLPCVEYRIGITDGGEARGGEYLISVATPEAVAEMDAIEAMEDAVEESFGAKLH